MDVNLLGIAVSLITIAQVCTKKNNRKVGDIVRLRENCLKIVNTQYGQQECGISFCK